MTVKAVADAFAYYKDKEDPAVAVIRAGGARASTKDYFQYSIPRTSLAAGAPGTAQTIQVPIRTDSYFVVTHMFAYSSGIFTAQIRNDADGRYFHSPNSKLNNVNIFGTLLLPNRLKDPIILPPNGTVSLTLADMANNGTNVVQVVLCGYRHYDFANPPIPTKNGRRTGWFALVTDYVLAANEGPTQLFAKIDAEADFLIRKLVATSTGEFAARIADAATGDWWSDQPQRNNNLFGTAQYPLILPKPKLIKAKGSLQIEVTDLSTSQNTLQIIAEGIKVY